MKLPEGWKEVELGDVLDYEQPTDYIVNSEDYSDEYKTPVLTAGKSFILGYTDEKDGIYNKLPVIIFDDFTVASKYVTFPFKVKSSAMKLLTPKNKDVNLKYIFWLMQTIKVNSVSHKRYYLSKYQRIRIPFPPFSTQQKIVSILEKAAEAKERRKEANELTKDFLKVVFMEMFLNSKNNFQMKEISEICETSSGGTPSRDKKEFWENGKILWVKSGELDRGYIYDTEEKITELALKNSSAKYFEPDTVLLAMYGATVGKAALLKVKATTNQAICGIRPKNKNNLNSIYLLHLLFSLKERLISKSIGGGQPNISQLIIKETKIPLPPIELQNKFAAIVKEVEQLKEQQKHSKEQIDNLFNVLMQKAFKGEFVE